MRRIYKISFFIVGMVIAQLSYSQVYVDQTAITGAQDGTSWANAYLDIQSAIDDAAGSGGGEVWVASGFYINADAELVISMASDVQIYGGFPIGGSTFDLRDYIVNPTIISGEYQSDGDSTNNTNHLVKNSGVNANALLDGFLLQHSYDIPGNNSNQNGRGAILNDNSSPTIQNCVFLYNTHNDGGAIANVNGASPTIRLCAFYSNRSVGWQSRGSGIFNLGSTPVIDSCIFEENTPVGNEAGSAIFNESSEPVISNCWVQNTSFSDGYAVGIYNLSSAGEIRNCKFEKLDIIRNGGAIYNENSATLIDSCLFDSITLAGAPRDGGAIYNTGIYNGTDYPLISNCIFNDITIWGSNGSGNGSNGAGIYVTAGGVNVSKCTFSDLKGIENPSNTFGHRAVKGVAIAAESNSIIVVDSCSFIDNYSSANAAGFMLNNSVGTFTNSTFIQDTALNDGGSMYIMGTSELNIDNCTFTEYRSGDLGGALYVTDSCEINISHTTFNDGSANSAGGCMYLLDKTSINFDSVTIANSVTQNMGGGVYMLNSKGLFNDCYIAGNEITGSNVDGAGIRVEGGFDNQDGSFTYPEFNNTTFDGNIIDGGNGANNGSEGGGLFLDGAIVSIDSCTFINNKMGLDDRSIKGAGLAVNAISEANVTNSFFENNTAILGGGLYNLGTLSLDNCIFIGDTCKSRGGGIYNENNTTTKITNCTFTGNVNNGQWQGGGAICNNSATAEIINCIFDGNILDPVFGGYGAAIYELESSSRIINCLFQNGDKVGGNGGGGAIAFDNSNTEVLNCTFVNNYAEFGGALIFTSQNGADVATSPIIANCIFNGNTSNSSSRGNEIRIDDDFAEPAMSNCIIEYTYAGINGGGSGANWTSAPDQPTFATNGNLESTDPLFFDPSSGDGIPENDFALTMLSPAVNQGDSTGLNLPATDLSGGVRISDSLVDMGAFEYQFVSGLTVQGAGAATTITINGDSLQMEAIIDPSSAYDTTVTWTIGVTSTADASITTEGMLKASGTLAGNGDVYVVATANDGTGIMDSVLIAISNQRKAVDSLVVDGTGGITAITVDEATLQMIVDVYPADADVNTVSWAVNDLNTIGATIDGAGLLTPYGYASGNGDIWVVVTADDNAAIKDSVLVSISGQVQLVTGITVTGAAAATTIDVDGGTLQMDAAISPGDADDQTVTWSVTPGAGDATIDASGVLTAVANGDVDVVATANDGSGISGSLTITISNQTIKVNDIILSGETGNTITADGGTLQILADVKPDNATDTTITWSIYSDSTVASIDQNGIVTASGTAAGNGGIWVVATANDVIGHADSIEIMISGQALVTGITVSGTGGATTIDSDEGTLQMLADVLPVGATDNSVTWSVTDGTGSATIDAVTGLLTAVDNGTVTVTATANDASGISDDLEITISGQIELVTGITINGAGGASVIDIEGGTLQLSVDVLPIGAADQTVTWSSDDTNVATVDASTGLVTAIADGSVTITATANDGSGITATFELTVSNQNVGVTNYTANIHIYPNPTTGIIHISGMNSQAFIQVTDITGKILTERNVAANEIKINLDYPVGLYFIKVCINNQTKVEKVILQ